MIILIVVAFTTRLNVSLKSKRGLWVNPFATKRVLCLCMDPSGFFFNLKIHLQPMTLWLGGKGTSDHVLLQRRVLYFSCIGVVHSGMCKAWIWEFGLVVEDTEATKARGLKRPNLEWVCIGWVESVEIWGSVGRTVSKIWVGDSSDDKAIVVEELETGLDWETDGGEWEETLELSGSKRVGIVTWVGGLEWTILDYRLLKGNDNSLKITCLEINVLPVSKWKHLYLVW